MNIWKTTAALAAFTAGAAIFTAPAHAGVIDYVKLSYGNVESASASGFDLNGGQAYGIHAGKAIGPIRLEVGYDHLSANADFGVTLNGEARDWNAIGYVDVPLSHNTTVFAGAGVDYVQADATIFGHTSSLEGRGYSLVGGIATRVGEHSIIEASYRQLEVDDLGGVDLSGGVTSVGWRYQF